MFQFYQIITLQMDVEKFLLFLLPPRSALSHFTPRFQRKDVGHSRDRSQVTTRTANVAFIRSPIIPFPPHYYDLHCSHSLPRCFHSITLHPLCAFNRNIPLARHFISGFQWLGVHPSFTSLRSTALPSSLLVASPSLTAAAFALALGGGLGALPRKLHIGGRAHLWQLLGSRALN